MSGGSGSGGERVVPYHCPYCGDEDLRPSEEGGHGAWECRACARAFSVRFLGIVVNGSVNSSRSEVSA
jgi:hypothetical protein